MAARPRSILLGLEIRLAGRACRCKHNAAHTIAKGQLRLILKNPGPAAGENGYCVPCGQAMLAAARMVLDDHSRSLEASNVQAPDFDHAITTRR